ncbi:hypothetical protein JXL19_07310 [bacterium]|nr:hypothetical protein [bacterium]
MNRKKKPFVIFNLLLIIIVLTATGSLILPTSPSALYWASLPPYNVLWPLWSDVLSPVNPVSGIATPLVSALTRNTILPVQPCLAWDPCQPGGSGLPWLLYNTPAALGSGLLFYDPFYGMNAWPPSYMLDPVTSAPSPIALPLGWSLLLPTDFKDLAWYVPLGNAYYANRFGLPFTGLLTSVDIWGLTPLALLPPSVI